MAKMTDQNVASSDTADRTKDVYANDLPVAADTELLEKARRFLEEEDIRTASRARKAAFLESKGIASEAVRELLGPDENDVQVSKPSSTTTDTATKLTLLESEKPAPPIITYPEFILSAAQAKPLITPAGLLHAASLLAGLSTMVYGVTKYAAEPMLESLTDARVDFHQNASSNIQRLVQRLETVVSRVPAPVEKPGQPVLSPLVFATSADGDSVAEVGRNGYDDPSEVSHRDVGVQTSPLSSPLDPTFSTTLRRQSRSSTSSAPPVNGTLAQEATLSRITSLLQGLDVDLTSEAEEYRDIGIMINVVDAEVQELGGANGYSSVASKYQGGWNSLGARGGAADDEFKTARDNIRKLKGALLGARTFPMRT